MKKTIILCILDGWGHNESPDYNAIKKAHTPTWDRLIQEFPHCLLDTSGLAVGLPEGQMGNSEVGHMTIGSGRVIMQDLVRIDHALQEKTIPYHPYFIQLIETLKHTNGTCHIAGLFSAGGVHAHKRHIEAMINYIKECNIPIILHLFLDGRDVSPQSALDDVIALEKQIAPHKNITIGTISGRYYAMDRDKRSERTAKTSDAIMNGKGVPAETAQEAIKKCYENGCYDEFILPYIIGNYEGAHENDALCMMNFRADRMRQIAHVLINPHSTDSSPSKKQWSKVISMVSYGEALDPHMDILFKQESITDSLAEILSKKGKTQLHIAETEKYAHVTYFFNGGIETLFPGEEHVLIPSPNVATYDLQPEMSSYALTTQLIDAITSQKFDFIVINYANADMVGHSGSEEATIKAVESIDLSLKRIMEVLYKTPHIMLITSDHGNAELLFDITTQQAHTSHTLNPVPCILVSDPKKTPLQNGSLRDIAPTILALMEIEKPISMSGSSLIIGETYDNI